MLVMPSPAERLSTSVDACVSNGRNLFEDASLLFNWHRFSTALALAVLAQEEFSKAFILQLVSDSALPWIQPVRQSISRHQCKHLLAIVMDWLPNIDDWLETYEQRKATQHAREASRGNPSTVLKEAATAYKVDTDAIAAKVKQESAAKEKAKKTLQPTAKTAKKAA
jgi:AbiV family abortive infection protein